MHVALFPKHVGKGLQRAGSSACHFLVGTHSEQQSHWYPEAAGTGLSTSEGSGVESRP